MITHIFVDGFKSLVDFSLETKPGLNVLVGPNGSGKTNIIHFYKFLSTFIESGLGDAVIQHGGADSIINKFSNSGTIRAKVEGAVEGIIYSYSFELTLDKDNNDFTLNSEEIRYSDSDILKPDLIISRDSEDKIFLDGKKSSNFKKTYDTVNTLSKYLKEKSLFEIAFLINPEVLSHIKRDMDVGDILNIIPLRVRALENVTGSPSIHFDGHGVAGVLRMLKKNDKKKLEEIIKLSKLVDSQIENIEAIHDSALNKLNIKVHISASNKGIDAPISILSDGSLKWIALITALHNNRNIIAIEEPENFFHPWMQTEFIKIIKSLFENGAGGFILLSTHSESLINAVDPEELVVVTKVQGVTKASRISEPEHLRKLINESGFGLGFYYTSNALGDS